MYQVIIADDEAKIRSGLANLELSRLLLPKKPVKMVFFSGYQDFNYARQAMKNGVSDYLLKPVKYEDLSDCLTRIRETLDKIGRAHV